MRFEEPTYAEMFSKTIDAENVLEDKHVHVQASTWKVVDMIGEM